jgi:beta-galactosidase
LKFIKELLNCKTYKNFETFDLCYEKGGLPYWLLTVDKNMKLRTSDKHYMSQVRQWFSIILPKIKPMLYQNGGPVIMVQVENEYAYYDACDHNYTNTLRDLLREHLGSEVILFTTDGIWNFKCAIIDKVFVTIDFGTKDDPHMHFGSLREHQKTGPLVNSEFYPGWINRWEMPYEHIETQKVADRLDELLTMNASVNMSVLSVYFYCFQIVLRSVC